MPAPRKEAVFRIAPKYPALTTILATRNVRRVQSVKSRGILGVPCPWGCEAGFTEGEPPDHDYPVQSTRRRVQAPLAALCALARGGLRGPLSLDAGRRQPRP